MSFNLSCTAQDLNVAVTKANAAAPQATTYTKNETDTLLAEKADLVDGKVPSSQLPSYVDDVLEYAGTSAFPVTGESGKIYVATDTNRTYRWGGSAYVEISESLALGETASTAYPGNKGKANADAIAKKPGEITTGKQYTIDGQTVTAGFGAEAFNNLASNKASGLFSHAEGVGTTAFGMGSHAEGASSTASGSQSHAEGAGATASGGASHAEGSGTTASGTNSHTEGYGTTASGDTSHAEGDGTTASSANQHVQGKYNVEDANNTYAFIIGNGTADNDRHNAFAIDWNGLIYVNGAATGVDVSALYTKSEVDAALSGKANTSDLGAAAAKGFDAAPTSGNTNNAVSSDGVYQALTPSIKTANAQPGITATRNYVAILGHICFVSFAFTCSENITSSKICFYLPNGFRSNTAFTSYLNAQDSDWVSRFGYITALDGAVYVRATTSAPIAAGTTIMMSGMMIIP